MSRMVAAQKLEFYATSEIMIYKMIPLLGRLVLKTDVPDMEYVKNLRTQYNQDHRTRLTFAEYVYDDLLTSGRQNEAHHYVSLNTLRRFNVVDFFAGEGRWLEIMKLFLGDKAFIYANELEEGRAAICEGNPNIDYTTQGPYEEMAFPMYGADLMLYNPPYDTINRVSCAEWYLNDIMKKQYMAKKSVIILVLNKKDMIACAPTLLNYYEIAYCFKAHEEEFNKWGQYVVIAESRDYALTDCNLYQKHQVQINEFHNLIEGASENIECNTHNAIVQLSGIDLGFALESLALSKVIPDKLSDPSSTLWGKIRKETTVKSTETTQLVTPRSLKPGEMSQVIAAGYINGEVVEGGHVVVGGVKLVESTQVATDDRGKECVSTLRASVPYLNILYRTSNGAIAIKELLKAGSKVIEDEVETDSEGDNK